MKGKIPPTIYLSTKMVIPAIVQIFEGIPPDNDSAFSQYLVSGCVTNPGTHSSQVGWHQPVPDSSTFPTYLHLYMVTLGGVLEIPRTAKPCLWNISRSRFAFSRHVQLIWKWNSSSPSHSWVARKPDGVASTKSGLQDSVDLRMEHMPHYCHVKFYLTGEYPLVN